MIGMRMCVDQIADTQAFPRRQTDVVVDLLQGGVDQHGGVGIAAADQVGS